MVSKFYSEIPIKSTNANNRILLKGLLRGNVVGDTLSLMSDDTMPSTLRSKCRINSMVGATSIILALQSFDKEQGRLPARLEELVPVYLSEIPLDDFDGKPLRYSREKLIVYSVGADLLESGGESKRNLDDIKFSIKPMATALKAEEKNDPTKQTD